MDHYQVKFNRGGKLTYGIVNNYGKEAKKLAKKGQLIVADAILPVSYVVKEADITDIPMSTTFAPDEYTQYVDDEYQKSQVLSDSLKGLAVGKLFAVGVADGSAFYIVTGVGKGPNCKIEWRSFQGDRYHDQVLGLGGSFSKTIIKRFVESN